MNFYPRPPRGGRLRILWDSFSDDEFLSTPSARRATLAAAFYNASLWISIHALREEGDHALCRFHGSIVRFLSTPSARRAT